MTSIAICGVTGLATLLYRRSQANDSPHIRLQAESGATFTKAVAVAALGQTGRAHLRVLDQAQTEQLIWLDQVSDNLPRVRIKDRMILTSANKVESDPLPESTDAFLVVVKGRHRVPQLEPLAAVVGEKPVILMIDVVPQADGIGKSDERNAHADLWQAVRTILPKVKKKGLPRILVTCAAAFRRAGHRVREEGSISASVEDICRIVLGSDPQGQDETTVDFFTGFTDVFVRLRGDAIVHVPMAPNDDSTARIFYALDSNFEEWTQFGKSLYGLDSIVAVCVAQWALSTSSERHLEEAVLRIWNLVKHGYGPPNTGDSFSDWVARLWADAGTQFVDKDSKRKVEVCTLDVDTTQVLLHNRWSLVEACIERAAKKFHGAQLPQATLEYAIHIAQHGFGSGKLPPKGFGGIKFFQLGGLQTVDRAEVEGLSGLKSLMAAYPADLAPKPGEREEKIVERPLCLAVFGAPGSGKSFGVEEIAKTLAGQQSPLGETLPRISNQSMTFNVSQFTTLEDLANALHQVREKRLTGRVPVAIFDEFDASFEGQPFGWLKYFLMPMQDGKFRDRQQEYRTGGCIMVFAGGINYNFAEFTSRLRDKSFSAAKGPDFISRLRGVHNIPSLADDGSKFCSWRIRRAVLLRDFLRRRGARIDDQRLLRALLTVDRFHHGARSMGAIIQMCAVRHDQVIDLTSLPRREQLDLHVDANRLWRLINVNDKKP